MRAATGWFDAAAWPVLQLKSAQYFVGGASELTSDEGRYSVFACMISGGTSVQALQTFQVGRQISIEVAGMCKRSSRLDIRLYVA